jgi:hypothetical protein
LYPDDTAPDLAGGATIGPLLLAIAVSASFSLILLLLSTQCQYNFIGDQICSPAFSLPTLSSFPPFLSLTKDPEKISLLAESVCSHRSSSQGNLDDNSDDDYRKRKL